MPIKNALQYKLNHDLIRIISLRSWLIHDLNQIYGTYLNHELNRIILANTSWIMSWFDSQFWKARLIRIKQKLNPLQVCFPRTLFLVKIGDGDGRVVEGVPNYSPPVKKSAVDIRSELSSVSEMIAVVPSAEKRRLMKSSFPERRFLIVKTQTKLTSLLKLFPALLTNEGVSVTGISAVCVKLLFTQTGFYKTWPTCVPTWSPAIFVRFIVRSVFVKR